MAEPVELAAVQAVDSAMAEWRQGDVAEVREFRHIADLRRPVTSPAIELAATAPPGNPVVNLGSAAEALVVLTQTCDIRRTSAERPYVEVCPVVRLDEETAKAVSARDMPRYAAIPALGLDAAADLDRVMTVEKGWLSLARRRSGWTTDSEIRLFQAAITRRYQRFAFPDDFTKSLSRLRKRILDKHGKQGSEEGRLFQMIKEIRVSASPDWASDNTEVTLTFILPVGTLGDLPEELVDDRRLQDTYHWLSAKIRASHEIAQRLLSEADSASKAVLWSRLGQAWAESCRPTGSIRAVYGEMVDAGEYPVAEYWATDQLDLDHLSDEVAQPYDSSQADVGTLADIGELQRRRGSQSRFRRLLAYLWSSRWGLGDDARQADGGAS